MPSPRAAAFVLALLLAAPARALKTETMGATTTAGGGAAQMVVASGQASVLFSTGTTTAQIDTALAGAGASRAGFLPGGWVVATWSDGSPVSTKLSALKLMSGASVVEPSKVYRAFNTPNDPLFNSQYALAAVEAPAGWNYEVGNSSRVTIVVIDAGIDSTQNDLSPKLANTSQMVFDQTTGAGSADGPPTTPACDHATHVAGVAAAASDNGLQVAGVSWGAQLVSYRVFATGSCTTSCGDVTLNSCGASDNAIAGAINQAISFQNTAQYGQLVINMSLGAPNTTCSGTIQSAINNAVNAGVVVVVAAGNSGGTAFPGINSPGNCGSVIPMGATDNTNSIAYFSSQGSQLATSGLVAPGVSVLTTDLNNGTVGATGTSFSTPMGAGLAALLISAKPTTTPNGAYVGTIQNLMRAGAQDLGQPGTAQGAGLMNVFRSLKLAKTGTLAGFDGDVKPIAFPNPFRLSQTPNVTFSFPSTLVSSNLDIKIYTLQGGFVRDLSEPLWDGKNASGNLVASGTYVFVVKTDKGTSTARLAVIR